LSKPKFVICLTKFVIDLTTRAGPTFSVGCARLSGRHIKEIAADERIIPISAKGRGLKMVRKLRRHAEGLTGEIVGVYPKVAFFIHCGGPQGHERLTGKR
jgi:hypothetical protein